MPLNQWIVPAVVSDPKPDHIAVQLLGDGSIVNSYPHSPILFHLLEMKRRMFGIRFQQFEILVRQSFDVGGQSFV
jgi:hypothetical protein